MRRIDFDLLPQLAYQNAKILNIAVVIAPNFLDQVLVGDDQSDMRGQRMKERIFFASQLDAVPCKVTILDTKSIESGPALTTGSRLVLRKCRRNAASLRASSSEIPNGLTT